MTDTNFMTQRVATIVMVIGLVIAVLGWTNQGPFIKAAQGYSQDIATSSAGTYLSLRLINSAISFAEEVEVGGSIIAVSGSAHPFKVLEPIDDAVERLSSAIFLVGTFAGVMTVVLPVLGGATLVMIGGSLVLLAGISLAGLRFPGQSILSNLAEGTSRIGGLGFLIVVAFSISSVFADQVSNRAWGEYDLVLTRIADQMPSLSQEELAIPATDEVLDPDVQVVPAEPEASGPAQTETGFLGRAMESLLATGDEALDIASSTVSDVKGLATGAVDSVRGFASSTSAAYTKAESIVVTLSTESDDLVRALMGVFAAFLFKTIFFPVLILIGLWKMAGSVLRVQ